MVKNWFSTVFLPSLFDKSGEGRGVWLTAKQTTICLENMKQHTTRDEWGERHTFATYNWNGRALLLSYSHKNGCGKLLFGGVARAPFNPNGKHLDTGPQIINYLMTCRSAEDLNNFTKWAGVQVIKLTDNDTETAYILANAYNIAVNLQANVLKKITNKNLPATAETLLILAEDEERKRDRAQSENKNSATQFARLARYCKHLSRLW